MLNGLFWAVRMNLPLVGAMAILAVNSWRADACCCTLDSSAEELQINRGKRSIWWASEGACHFQGVVDLRLRNRTE